MSIIAQFDTHEYPWEEPKPEIKETYHYCQCGIAKDKHPKEESYGYMYEMRRKFNVNCGTYRELSNPWEYLILPPFGCRPGSTHRLRRSIFSSSISMKSREFIDVIWTGESWTFNLETLTPLKAKLLGWVYRKALTK